MVDETCSDELFTLDPMELLLFDLIGGCIGCLDDILGTTRKESICLFPVLIGARIFRGKMRCMRKVIFNIIMFFMMIFLSLFVIEGLFRLKNLDHKNYIIEMWRYAKLLRIYDGYSVLGHEHVPNQKVILENVEVRFNAQGLRGPEVDLADHSHKRVLVLGNSNTFGWGVEERQIMTSLLQEELILQAVVINDGVCNYNSVRYVRLFKDRLRGIHPDIVVVEGNIRDAEELQNKGNNFLVRHSQLMAMTSYALQLLQFRVFKRENLFDHYKNLYVSSSRGFQEMSAALNELDQLSKTDGFKIIYLFIPESRSIDGPSYLTFHEKIRHVVEALGWTYVDATKNLHSITPEDLWVMPFDPHYNARGQKVMADTLLPYLRNALNAN